MRRTVLWAIAAAIAVVVAIGVVGVGRSHVSPNTSPSNSGHGDS